MDINDIVESYAQNLVHGAQNNAPNKAIFKQKIFTFFQSIILNMHISRSLLIFFQALDTIQIVSPFITTLMPLHSIAIKIIVFH